MKLVPPHDLDAEQAVIGAMLVSEHAVIAVADRVEAEDFYSETHRVIYRAAMKLYAAGTPIDQRTLTTQLEKEKEYEKVGGREYIFRLVESVPVASNAYRYAEIVRDKSLLRASIDAASRIQQESYSDPQDVGAALDGFEQTIFDVASKSKKKGVSENQEVGELVGGVLDDIQRMHEAGGNVMGLRSGYADLDRLTTGSHPSDLIILAARPAMGKTSMALGECHHAAKHSGGAVQIFSLEMSKEQLVQRLVSSESGISITDIKTGSLDEDGMDKVFAASAQIAKLPLWIDDDPEATVAAMRAKTRRLSARLKSRGQKLSLVMVDYLQLMVDDKKQGENRNNELSAISRGLKVLARDLQVPVLALAQLSRAVESLHNKRPLLSHLRDSGAIEQDADQVRFIYRDEYYNPDTDDRGEAEIIVAKHRNGPTGTVKLAFVEHLAKFGSLAPGSLDNST